MSFERLGLILVLLGGLGCEAERPDAPGFSGQLRLGSVLGGDAAAGYARADGVRPFRFPVDHGPHPSYRSEWWYLTVALEDQRGAAYGVQFTLFRQALTPDTAVAANPWQTPQAYIAHFAVTDVAARRHEFEERYARGHPRLAGVQADPFRLWLEDWRMDADGHRWRLQARGDAQAVDLVLEMDQRPVLQGDRGLSRKGPGQASYYYSIPGIAVRGTLQLGRETKAVAGLGWLDREWSTSVLAAEQLGWDWFALQLDDGRRLMAFQLRRRDGTRDPFDQGLLIPPRGPAVNLGTEDFTLTPVRYWTDRRGARWPVAWRIELPADVLLVEAALDDQLMDTSVRYWEGLVGVYDATRSQRVGRGYLELTGYDRAAETKEEQ